MQGFGCQILAFDRYPDESWAREKGVTYASLDGIFSRADILSLHIPLTPETRHLLDRRAFEKMKPGVMLINTGRGALIESRDLIEALKGGRVGAAGLDVYEEEENCFFQDLSNQVLQDDVLARLLSFPNVLITSHQGFLTDEALRRIAETTLESATAFEKGQSLKNVVRAEEFLA